MPTPTPIDREKGRKFLHFGVLYPHSPRVPSLLCRLRYVRTLSYHPHPPMPLALAYVRVQAGLHNKKIYNSIHTHKALSLPTPTQLLNCRTYTSPQRVGGGVGVGRYKSLNYFFHSFPV